MRTERGCRRVELTFHRSFRRPVKIRIEPEPLRSADRIASPFPAGPLFLTPPLPSAPRECLIRLIRLELAPQPDWRIMGDSDPEFADQNEASCV